MGDNWYRDPIPGDADALDFSWGVDCGNEMGRSEWCFYPEPHKHGFACDKTCPCRVERDHWEYQWRKVAR